MKMLCTFMIILFCSSCISIKDKKACKKEVIKSIGGCDQNGRCGVELENGEYSKVNYPVVGELRLICRNRCN